MRRKLVGPIAFDRCFFIAGDAVMMIANVLEYCDGRIARSRMARLVCPYAARAVARNGKAVGVLFERGRFA